MHLPAPTTGADPHEQQWFWMPANRPYRYDCRHICPLTQYGLQCGHKLSDDGLNAMTAQGPRNEERGKVKKEPSPVAHHAKPCAPLPTTQDRVRPVQEAALCHDVTNHSTSQHTNVDYKAWEIDYGLQDGRSLPQPSTREAPNCSFRYLHTHTHEPIHAERTYPSPCPS